MDRFPASTRRRTLAPALGLAFLAAATGCTSNGQTTETTSATQSPTITTDCGPLQSFNPISETSKVRGGYNAVNTGECVGLYSPKTSKTVGILTAGANFIIICERTKPAAYDIQAGDVTGTANVADAALDEFNSGELPIPECQSISQ